jgi:methionyl aminopeptidase
MDKLKAMRESNRITHETLQNCKKVILDREEITKEEVEILAKFALTRYNVKSAFQGVNNFPGVMCISVNDEVIHGMANNSKIVKGDVVSLDFGVIYEGYYSDAAITFVNNNKISNPISPKRRLVRDTQKAVDAAIDSLRSTYPNCKISDITSAVQLHADDGDYGVVLGYGGHGIGKSLHERHIFVPNHMSQLDRDQELKIGEFFTIEPMFTMGAKETEIGEDGFTIKTVDGSLSAHIEYSIAITEDGIEVLGIEEK